MHTLALICVNKQMKFEVPSFTISKDIIGIKFEKTDHVTLTTPLLSVTCPAYAGTWYGLLVYKIWSLQLQPFHRYGWCPPKFE